MKRRSFLKSAGMGASAAVMGSQVAKANSGLPDYSYGKISSLDEAKNDEGLIALRVSFSSKDSYLKEVFKGNIQVTDGELVHSKAFHFENDDDQYHPQGEELQVLPGNLNEDVMALWIKDASNNTSVQIQGKLGSVQFKLKELIQNTEAKGSVGEINWSANLLLYKEIGEIDPKDVGINRQNKNFNFVILGDPQGGDPFKGKQKLATRMRIHNAFLEESIDLVGRLNCDPQFAIAVGDITDGWGAQEDFEQMNAYMKELRMPVLYSIGNHETLLRSKFTPGYNMEAFNHYFSAQKQINGLDKLLYSFNVGEWHFIVWPDPLRPGFWETHPHYFDWLERDLEKYKDKPTMIFQHVHLHPIGITPLINYAESVPVKKELLKIYTEHGNVKYVFSGHVHIPLKASFKTAVTINGTNFINLPVAGYRPRAFGEADYHGGPSQGVAIVEVNGKEIDVTYKTVTEEEYLYPKKFPEFKTELYSLWFSEKWEIPAQKEIVNGSFEKGLKGWGKRYIYMEDNQPANICEIRKINAKSPNALYLFNRIRGYMAPGQDRWPQDINRIHQAVLVDPKANPGLTFFYKIDADNSVMDDLCGGYVWIEGFSGTTKQFNLMYSISTVWANIGGNQGLLREVDPIQLELTDRVKGWNAVVLNFADDFNRFTQGRTYKDAGIDRIVINLGVWNGNDGTEKPFGIYFDELKTVTNIESKSMVNGYPVIEKPVEKRWWRNKITPNRNIAGEHRYILDTATRFTVTKYKD